MGISILLTHTLYGNEPIILKEKNATYSVRGQYLDMYTDSTGNRTISEISSPGFTAKFLNNNKDIPRIYTDKFSYWIRFSVADQCQAKTTWLIELYDFETDHFEIYIPDGKGGFLIKKGGDNYPFSIKEFYHKNFVFELSGLSENSQTFYIRFHSQTPVGLMPVIRSIQTFSGYATTEYYCLAIFYGLALAMLIYNLFLYFTVYDRAYLYYVLYVASIAVYILCHDGTGFEYLWPDYPSLNRYIQTCGGYGMLVFALLYSKSFLSLKVISPRVNQLLTTLIVLRSVLFVTMLLFFPEIRYILYLDIACLLIAYTAGWQSFRKGFTPARYYLLAFTFFFSGFIITSLEDLDFLLSNVFTVYSLNFGLVGEMLLLSFALGDRIKNLVKEKDKAQQAMIEQLREKELLKDKLNKDLEIKVLERTKELEEKNKELDTFIFKASHDIKGPLRSIMGLTTIGLQDVKEPIAITYFEHILKSTSKLDSLLSDLLKLNKVKQAVLEKAPIQFHDLMDEILKSFQHSENIKKINITLQIDQQEDFFSDKRIIHAIIHNLIENPIKYINPKENNPYLHISIKADKDKAVLKFSDNGLGIDKEHQPKIFDMFYKISKETAGTGLGLHIVKVSVEKLGGQLSLESEPERGAIFTVVI